MISPFYSVDVYAEKTQQRGKSSASILPCRDVRSVSVLDSGTEIAKGIFLTDQVYQGQMKGGQSHAMFV